MKPHPLRLPQASTQEAEKGCHTLKTNPVQQSPDTGTNATFSEEDDRLLPPLGSPGCTLGNPASPPTPRELIRKILLLGSSNLQWRGSQARLRLWTCPVVFRLDGGSPAQAHSSATLSFEREWRSNTILKGQRSNRVIAFTVTCSAFHRLHK